MDKKYTFEISQRDGKPSSRFKIGLSRHTLSRKSPLGSKKDSEIYRQIERDRDREREVDGSLPKDGHSCRLYLKENCPQEGSNLLRRVPERAKCGDSRNLPELFAEGFLSWVHDNTQGSRTPPYVAHTDDPAHSKIGFQTRAFPPYFSLSSMRHF